MPKFSHANPRILAASEAARLQTSTDMIDAVNSQAGSACAAVEQLIGIDNSCTYIGNQVFQLKKFLETDTSTADILGCIEMNLERSAEAQEKQLAVMERIAVALEALAGGAK